MVQEKLATIIALANIYNSLSINVLSHDDNDANNQNWEVGITIW